MPEKAESVRKECRLTNRCTTLEIHRMEAIGPKGVDRCLDEVVEKYCGSFQSRDAVAKKKQSPHHFVKHKIDFILTSV